MIKCQSFPLADVGVFSARTFGAKCHAKNRV